VFYLRKSLLSTAIITFEVIYVVVLFRNKYLDSEKENATSNR